MNKIKISAVEYLNSKPFIYGLEKSEVKDHIDLSLDMPSICAEKLINNQVDISLVPVIAIPKIKEAHIITDFCIGAVGRVSSVMLYSEVSLQEIKEIILDYQSNTSVAMVKVLAKNFWNINPQWKKGSEGFEKNFGGTTAAVIIGDRTLQMEKKHPFIYDLAEEWMKFSGLPFVFACWVANKKLDDNFLKLFNEAITFGIRNKEFAIQEWSEKFSSKVNVREYLEKSISYPFDDAKKKGLELFLRLAVEINEL